MHPTTLGSGGPRSAPAVAVAAVAVAAGVVALLLGVAAGGCGAGEPGGPLAPAGAPGTAVAGADHAAPVGDGDGHQAVLAAYQGYWRAWLEANDPPDPDHPALARHHVGAALTRARASIAEHRERGLAVRLPEGSRYRHDAVVARLDGDEAVVHDCAHDDAVVVGPSGEVVDDSAVTSRAEAALRRIEGTWRVEDVQVLQRWEGLVPCDG